MHTFECINIYSSKLRINILLDKNIYWLILIFIQIPKLFKFKIILKNTKCISNILKLCWKK